MSTDTRSATGLKRFATTDSNGIADAIETEGCAFIPGALSPELSAETCRQIDALDFPPGDNRGEGTGVDHHKCVFNRDPFWLQFIDQPGIVEGVEQLLGDQCHIIGMSAGRSPPGVGSDARKMHIAHIFIPLDGVRQGSGRLRLPVFLMTLHFYLVDIDLDLCPTWVIPGSHLSGRGPNREPIAHGHPGTITGPEETWDGREQVPVLCAAGDAMLFRSEIWHRGSRNQTPDRTRYLLQVHYAQRGIAQRFPPYLEFRHNPAVIAAANERQLRMLGKHRIGAYG
jgi:hypothetical protein